MKLHLSRNRFDELNHLLTLLEGEAQQARMASAYYREAEAMASQQKVVVAHLNGNGQVTANDHQKAARQAAQVHAQDLSIRLANLGQLGVRFAKLLDAMSEPEKETGHADH